MLPTSPLPNSPTYFPSQSIWARVSFVNFSGTPRSSTYSVSLSTSTSRAAIKGLWQPQNNIIKNYSPYTENAARREESGQIAEIQVLYRCNLGGTDHLGNLQLLCANCNAIKGNRGGVPGCAAGAGLGIIAA